MRNPSRMYAAPGLEREHGASQEATSSATRARYDESHDHRDNGRRTDVASTQPVVKFTYEDYLAHRRTSGTSCWTVI